MADAGKKLQRPRLLRALIEPLGTFVRQDRVRGAVQEQQRARRQLGHHVRAALIATAPPKERPMSAARS